MLNETSEDEPVKKCVLTYEGLHHNGLNMGGKSCKYYLTEGSVCKSFLMLELALGWRGFAATGQFRQ